MLVLSLALALDAAAPAKIELLCTLHPHGNTVNHRFSIDPSSRTYTDVMNGDSTAGGSADVADDAITLTSKGDKITFTYRISRVTGQVAMLGALNGQAPVVSFMGTCQKFIGNVF